MKKTLFLLLLLFLFFAGCRSTTGADPLQREYRVVDLTHSLHSNTPIFPGGSPFALENSVDMSQGYYMNRFSMGEHTGTHMDAPAHFAEGQAFVDEIPAEKLIAPAAVIDVREKAKGNPDYLLTVEDIHAWEEQHGMLPEGAVVILRSGWEERAQEQARYRNADASGALHFPGFAVESAQFLVQERFIRGIATDTLSLDYGLSKAFSVHRIILGAGKYQIENLCNLDALPLKGALLMAFPLKIRKGSGAPARVIALVPKE